MECRKMTSETTKLRIFDEKKEGKVPEIFLRLKDYCDNYVCVEVCKKDGEQIYRGLIVGFCLVDDKISFYKHHQPNRDFVNLTPTGYIEGAF